MRSSVEIFLEKPAVSPIFSVKILDVAGSLRPQYPDESVWGSEKTLAVGVLVRIKPSYASLLTFAAFSIENEVFNGASSTVIKLNASSK